MKRIGMRGRIATWRWEKMWKLYMSLLILLGLCTGALAATQYAVEVQIEPPESGTVLGDGIYNAGDTVKLTALPNEGFEFAGWFEDGEELGEDPLLEFIADWDRIIVAKFKPVFVFAGLKVISEGELRLIPTLSLKRNRLEVRPSFLYGRSPWGFRFTNTFSSTGWSSFQANFTGSVWALRLGGGLSFAPSAPELRSAYAMASTRLDRVSLSLRTMYYPRSGVPPSPYLLHNVRLTLPGLSLSARFEDKDGLEFKDLMVYLRRPFELCCGIGAQGTVSFTKEQGFSYARLVLSDIPLGCCGIRLRTTVTFAPDKKELKLTPKWKLPCRTCLSIYGDVDWDEESFSLKGLNLYGYRIRCCFGACCPRGPGSSLELLTAFDPKHVPGGFRGEEFEYLKLTFCGPACCDSNYKFEATVYFVPSGFLFGFSRVKVAAEIPVSGLLTLKPALESSSGGVENFGIGWKLAF